MLYKHLSPAINKINHLAIIEALDIVILYKHPNPVLGKL